MLLAPLLFICQNGWAQQTPGLIQSLNTLTSIIQKEKKTKNSKNDKSKLLKIDFKKYSLSDIYVKETLIYTPTRYLVLAKKDECSLYDVFLADLLLPSLHGEEEILLQETGKKGYVSITKKMFINEYIPSKCPKSISLLKYFEWPAIKKTIKTISFKSPTDLNQCFALHEKYLNDVKLPHLCGIEKNIRSLRMLKSKLSKMPKKDYDAVKKMQVKVLKYSRIKKILSKDSTQYLNQLCDYLDSPLNFCSQFFEKSYWSKVLRSEKPKQALRMHCQAIIKKNKLTDRDYKKCVQILKKNRLRCSFHENAKDSLIPWPDCDDISLAQNNSRIYNLYDDCPSKVGSEGIVSISRLVAHKNKSIPAGINNCATSHAANFVNFNIPQAEQRNWKTQVCFHNKINNAEECYPTLLSNTNDSKYSIGTTVLKILSKTRGAKPSLKCSVITKEEYKPTLLKFKTGCFIITKKDCTELACNPDIILDEVKMAHIYFKEGLYLDYDPGRVQEEKLSQVGLLKDTAKVRHKRILNLTLLKSFFKEFPNALAHGVGCAHDILPEFFSYKTLGECSPLSFVISGLIEKDGFVSVVSHTGADNIHAPRILSWSRIVNGLNSYQQFHPINLWSLYGIY